MADSQMLTSWYQDYMKSQPSTAQATTTNWTPDANSTVSDQVTKITSQGSPLIDQAQTAAKQASASRGLLNSTMAITAGQDAAYKVALPIAQQDASTYATSQRDNAAAANTTSQFNANASNTALTQQRGAGIESEAAAQQRAEAALGRQQQTALQAADFAQQDKSQAAELASRYDLATMDVESRKALQAADFANQQKLQQAQAQLQTGLQATDLAVKQSMQQFDAATQIAMQGKDNESKLALATLQADSNMELAKLEAKYKTELQGNQSMAASYQSMVDSFTRVMLDRDLDAPAKQQAFRNLTTLYGNGLMLQADVAGLKLGDLLDAEWFKDPIAGGAGNAGSAGSGSGGLTEYEYANPGGY